MFRSIRARLIASYVLFTLLTISLVGVMGISLVKRYIDQQETEFLTSNAEAIARQALPLIWPFSQPREIDELVKTAAFLGNARVKIFDSRYRLLADSGPPTAIDQFVWIDPPFELRVGLQGNDFGTLILRIPSEFQQNFAVPSNIFPDAFFENLPPETKFTFVERVAGPWGNLVVFEDDLQPPLIGPDRSTRSIQVPIQTREKLIGYVELRDGPNFGGEALSTIRNAFLGAAMGAVFLAGIVGFLIARRLAAPVDELAAVTKKMGDGDLTVRAESDRKDEIGQLAGHFNHMAERLEASFRKLEDERDTLRRFIADASHELRTPITALKNFNELIQGPASQDKSASRDFLIESQKQIERLEWITQNLLELSRLDGGLVSLDRTPEDLSDILLSVAKVYQSIADEHQLKLALPELMSPVVLLCDRLRIESALGNLLDNAIKNTPDGGHIEVDVDISAENVRILIRDNGRGIDPADVAHIFKRFYRGRNAPKEGSGLGLAIVLSVAQAHGGRVWVESKLGEGSCFILELPKSD